jgi:hypothetical protein
MGNAKKRQPQIVSETFRYTPRIVLLTMLLFCGGSLLCTGGTVLVVNGICQRNAADWIPLYPNGEVVREGYSFIQPFGMGITQVQIETDDAPTVVRQWYIEARRENDPNPTNLLATMRYNIQAGENGGTVISLYSECAWT